jgi:hypothetical protein
MSEVEIKNNLKNYMKNTLDLRAKKTVRGDVNWIAGWVLASVLLVTGFGYMAWLDNGCPTNGVMTWQGKTCV